MTAGACRRRRAVAGAAVVVLVVLAAAPAAPAGVPDSLSPGARAAVAAVIDGDTVVLAEPVDGASQVRLVGLQAPKLPLGRKGFPTWPLAERSKRALQGLVEGRAVTLYFGGTRLDRHGRLLAHLGTDDGRWVQGEMLGLGMARVYTFADNRAAVDAMLERERRARSAAVGIWGHLFYTVREPEDLDRDIGTFQVVEGRVLDAAKVKGRVYLNFGADWRTDFTVSAAKPALKLFAEAGLDPLSFEGRKVRVRGWLKRRNGPMIELSHPEQIEVVKR